MYINAEAQLHKYPGGRGVAILGVWGTWQRPPDPPKSLTLGGGARPILEARGFEPMYQCSSVNTAINVCVHDAIKFMAGSTARDSLRLKKTLFLCYSVRFLRWRVEGRRAPVLE